MSVTEDLCPTPLEKKTYELTGIIREIKTIDEYEAILREYREKLGLANNYVERIKHNLATVELLHHSYSKPFDALMKPFNFVEI